jgi:serine/threonine protein kinase
MSDFEKEIDQLPEDNIIGSSLKGRYTIDRYLDRGENGFVYVVTDLKKPRSLLVMKMTSEYMEFAQEIKMMRRISRHSCERFSTPEVVDYGLAMYKNQLHAWVIMPRYGYNLDLYCGKLEYKLSNESILDIGKAVLFTLEATHKAGYVYNDLKLDNLMVGYGQKVSKNSTNNSMFRDCTIHLVDFGYASKYLENEGTHIK